MIATPPYPLSSYLHCGDALGHYLQKDGRESESAPAILRPPSLTSNLIEDDACMPHENTVTASKPPSFRGSLKRSNAAQRNVYDKEETARGRSVRSESCCGVRTGLGVGFKAAAKARSVLRPSLKKSTSLPVSSGNPPSAGCRSRNPTTASFEAFSSHASIDSLLEDDSTSTDDVSFSSPFDDNGNDSDKEESSRPDQANSKKKGKTVEPARAPSRRRGGGKPRRKPSSSVSSSTAGTSFSSVASFNSSVGSEIAGTHWMPSENGKASHVELKIVVAGTMPSREMSMSNHSYASMPLGDISKGSNHSSRSAPLEDGPSSRRDYGSSSRRRHQQRRHPSSSTGSSYTCSGTGTSVRRRASRRRCGSTSRQRSSSPRTYSCPEDIAALRQALGGSISF